MKLRSQMLRRFLAGGLSLAMAVSMCPSTVFAAEEADTEEETVVVETEDTAEVEAVEEAPVEDSADETAEEITEETEEVTEEVTESYEDVRLQAEEEEGEEATSEESSEQIQDTYYVYMNIPYADFYATEFISVGQSVDVVSTATTQKCKGTTGLAKATYNNNTDNILGVTYPVAMDAETYDALAENKVTVEDGTELYAAMGTAADYAFADYTGTPAAYKTVTYADGTYTFGAVEATEKDASALSLDELVISGSYGNYQINLNGVLTAGTINGENAVIAGIVFTTSDGMNYPMYMLDNIWLGTRVTNVEIAWCVSGAPEVLKGHGSGPAFFQYDMNGKTIINVKVITDIGVYNISGNVTLPKFDTNNSLAVTDITGFGNETDVTANLAEDFKPSYKVTSGSTEIEASVADGKLSIPKGTAPGSYTLTASDTNGVYADVSTTFTVSRYALVNIPYAYFYKEELNNDVDVDVFTSATKSKSTQTGGLAGSTYHTEDGSEVTGVTYPALISGTTGLTVVDSKDALANAASWSYILLDEEPAQYKVITVTAGFRGSPTTYSVGKINVEPTIIKVKTGSDYDETAAAAAEATFTLSTQSSYGDYQLDPSNITVSGNIYGAYISTQEGNDYGMRTLENIWKPKNNFAWCTGFTSEVHGCLTSSAHYAAMMGQSISSVTYLTDAGNVTYKFTQPIYVPIKSDAMSLTVSNAYCADGQTKAEITLPEDYQAEYTFSAEGFSIDADTGVISYPATTANGSYKLTIKDAKGVYADLVASFTIKADSIPASYDASKKALVKADGASDEAFAAYLKEISSVTVGETSYTNSTKGFHGALAALIVTADGSIDTAVVDTNSAAVFGNGLYKVTVNTSTYDALTFTVDTRKEQTITVASAYSKKYGDKAFALNAKAETILRYASNNTKVATVDAKGNVTIKGVGTAVITVSAAESDTVKAATAKVTIKVTKASQTVSAKNVSKSLKKASLKKKASTFAAKATAKTTVTYKVAKYANTKAKKYLSINSKTGKVSVKKGTPKGTYKMTVKATAAATANYNAATKSYTVTVKVK